ncbi:phosphoribosylglycinamide formyltransferase [Bacillus canaveralius]|uniref:Phosphoribosylglycinamide formyltransferase n=1 Tax=Bacillus canaveralius TaxID=1403243 RepID=A0A2N5GJD6_9BACI|nr:phosphoribosylglycinamide formyltransferase [Bacillus canaveralius]PLR81308.1 phosphoribosylglycinamide formyltransferase [Bacillus canaveralius]PLS00526.1 phosphoribosylglycinamide formyltransferase [Bacillus canaveralius]RSK43824.1 phosphoribosylglycinamide formyltransferase [Bacillus canaveralius]
MKNIAVFASGNGSNFQAIIDAVEAGKVDASIKLLVCDRENAFAIERAKKAGIPQFVFSAKDYASKADYEKEILFRLNELGVEFVILAGYMRLIGAVLLSDFEGKIVNIHPSLLPAFTGKDAIGQALKARVKMSGVTIHFVDAGMDTGPIIAQQAVGVSADDTRESLQEKIQKIEHELYPQILHELFTAGEEKQ